jgi:hypothetical protein
VCWFLFDVAATGESRILWCPKHRNKPLLSTSFTFVKLTNTKPFNFLPHLRPSRKTVKFWSLEAAADIIASNFTDQISFPSYAEVHLVNGHYVFILQGTSFQKHLFAASPAGSSSLPAEAPNSNIILHISNPTSARGFIKFATNVPPTQFDW